MGLKKRAASPDLTIPPSERMAPFLPALLSPLPQCDLPPRRPPLSSEQQAKYSAVLEHFNDEGLKLPRSLKSWKALGGGSHKAVGLSSKAHGKGPEGKDGKDSVEGGPSLASTLASPITTPLSAASSTSGPLPSTSAAASELEGLSDEEKCFLTKECFLRYLRAVKWDLKQALARTEEVVVWRREYGVDRDADLDLVDWEDEAEVGAGEAQESHGESKEHEGEAKTANGTAVKGPESTTSFDPTASSTVEGSTAAESSSSRPTTPEATSTDPKSSVGSQDTQGEKDAKDGKSRHLNFLQPTQHHGSTYPPLGHPPHSSQPSTDPRRRPSQITASASTHNSRSSSPTPQSQSLSRARAHTHSGAPQRKNTEDGEGGEGGDWKGLTAEEVEEESRTGKQFVLGYDVHSRPCLHMYPYRQNTKVSPRQIRFVVWCLERTIDLMPPGVESLALLIDFGTGKAGGGGQPTTLGQARQVLTILQTYYAERLGRAICVNVPFLFWGFYKLVGPFIDPVTKEKIRFNPNVRELVPPEQLEKDCFGGDLDYKYDHEAYYSTLTKLAAERRAAMLRRWRQFGNNRCGASEWILRGGDEAHADAADAASTPVEGGSSRAASTRAGSIVAGSAVGAEEKAAVEEAKKGDKETGKDEKDEKDEKRSSRPKFAKHDRGDSVHSMQVPDSAFPTPSSTPLHLDTTNAQSSHSPVAAESNVASSEPDNAGDEARIALGRGRQDSVATTGSDAFFTPVNDRGFLFSSAGSAGGAASSSGTSTTATFTEPVHSEVNSTGVETAKDEKPAVQIRDDDEASALAKGPELDHDVGKQDHATQVPSSPSTAPGSGAVTPSKNREGHHHGFMHHLKEAMRGHSPGKEKKDKKNGGRSRRGTKTGNELLKPEDAENGPVAALKNEETGKEGRPSRAGSIAGSIRSMRSNSHAGPPPK